ncbi:MAG: ligase-associated DNA damage response exonuclease [Pseudomonadota bacterium]
MQARDLLTMTEQGLYCPQGDFHIDPVRPVPRAVVTHAHGDHCRPGHEALLASPETVVIAKTRYGDDAFASTQALDYGEVIRIGDVDLRLAPAGHVLGSSQVVIEKGGVRAVVSGDYKRRGDPSCQPFELVACDLFVTEATFGLPVFRHPAVEGEIAKLLRSLETFPDRAHAVGAYALGKAQRLLMELRAAGYDRPVWLHGALIKLCDAYRALGRDLGETRYATAAEGSETKGAIVLAPPSALADTWCRRLPDPIVAAASGWMRVRQRAKQRGVELAMVISDHADWDELCDTILETGAAEIWVTHGAEEALCHWCATQGIEARPLSIAGRGEED